MPPNALGAGNDGYYWSSDKIEYMNESRSPPERDRLRAAKLTGLAQHHARWRELTSAETALAVTELRVLAAGRTDLLAEQAGLLIGFGEGSVNEAANRHAAELLIAAGAEESLIPHWIDEGRRRRRSQRPRRP